MGDLHLGYDQVTGERVAIKLLRAGTTNPERFAREGAVLAELRHPGIVRHIAHGALGPDGHYLAMEWLEGEDLAERLRRERLGVSEVVALGVALARALSAAHAMGVIHRDLKPANVFLPGFRPQDAKLLDFGLARVKDPVRDLTRTGAVLGTRGYMAPEQVAGDRLSVDARADLFSLGCVLYESLCDGAPFEAQDSEEVLRRILFLDPEPLSTRRPGLPLALVAIIERLLEKEPDARPASAEEVAAALAAVPVIQRRDGLRLSVLRGPDAGLVRSFGELRVDVGKHPSASLSLRDGSMSRFHCELSRLPSGATGARDLGSTHGLHLEGQRSAAAELRDGAVLELGRSHVRVERIDNGDFGAPEHERARDGDANVMLEGEGDARAFAERLHQSSPRRRGPFAAVYGSALRIADVSPLSGGTLLLLEADALPVEVQHELAHFAETRAVPTSRGKALADVRLVTHAGADLRLAVNGRRFLPELFAALAGVRVGL